MNFKNTVHTHVNGKIVIRKSHTFSFYRGLYIRLPIAIIFSELICNTTIIDLLSWPTYCCYYLGKNSSKVCQSVMQDRMYQTRLQAGVDKKGIILIFEHVLW